MFELSGTILIALWCVLHFAMVALVLPQTSLKRFVLLLLLFGFSVIYISKPYTYDLTWYLEYFEYPHSFYEPAFVIPSLFLSEDLNWKPESILWFWQALTFIILYLSITNYVKHSSLLVVVAILASVIFVLGSQNGLRQGISLAFLILMVALLVSKKWLLACTAGILTIKLHNSGFYFLAISIAFWLIYQFYIVRSQLFRNYYLFKLSLIGLLFGVLLMWSSKVYYGDSIYLDKVAFNDPDRTDSMMKMLAIAATFTISEWIIKDLQLNKAATFNRFFRFFIFFILLPMSLLPEAFARTTYFYYTVELVLICCLLYSKSYRARLAGVLLMFSYGVAPNAIHVISGVI